MQAWRSSASRTPGPRSRGRKRATSTLCRSLPPRTLPPGPCQATGHFGREPTGSMPASFEERGASAASLALRSTCEERRAPGSRLSIRRPATFGNSPTRRSSASRRSSSKAEPRPGMPRPRNGCLSTLSAARPAIRSPSSAHPTLRRRPRSSRRATYGSRATRPSLPRHSTPPASCKCQALQARRGRSAQAPTMPGKRSSAGRLRRSKTSSTRSRARRATPARKARPARRSRSKASCPARPASPRLLPGSRST